MIVGYARVSSDSQHLELQRERLAAAGCEKIFEEKADRAQLEACLTALKVGDTLVITKLDRLGRSAIDLLRTVHSLAQRGVHFKSLGDAWLDTSTPIGRYLLIAFAGLAELDREWILERAAAGRESAQKMGVKFGRSHVLTLHQCAEANARLKEGETVKAVARSYNVDPATIRRARGMALHGAIR
jgi:DNA invertase Pin-like site-specific DNA recombinase